MNPINTAKAVSPSHSGLEDIIATESSICFIDAPRTRLIYRGYSINDLASQATFEEVLYLLWYGHLPNQTELKAFSEKLSQSCSLPAPILERMQTLPKAIHPMMILRTLVSALSFYDSEAENMSREANLNKSIRLTAQIPYLIAAWDRIRKGEKVIEPRKDFTHAQNFLYMLTGKIPDPLDVKALDLYLILLADHELNASTFALRVTASTLSDYYSALTSAIGTLKGPLHGGANEQVIKMLLEIGDIDKVDAFLKKAFSEKKKIMGFGHRVYKVQDPRSPLLKDMSKKVCEKAGKKHLFEMSQKIEAAVTSAKKLPSNVDFYSATLLYCIGIPSDLFTPLFVMSRIAGYSAHYMEQIADNRLIRPRAHYTGPMDLPIKPLHQR